MKKEYPYIIVGAIIFLALVGAIQITNFSNSLTSENLTFTGSNDFQRNLSIPRYSNVTSATINITGSGPNVCYQESANISDQSGTDGNCGLNYSGNYDFNNNLNDGDWTTSFLSGQRYNELTYVVPNCNPSSAIWVVKDKGGISRLSIPENISDLDVLNFKIESTSTGTSAIARWRYINSTGAEILLHQYYSQWDFSGYNGYEEAIEWNCVSPNSEIQNTEFPQLSVNNTVIWSLFGSFLNVSNATLFTLNDSSSEKNTSFYESDTLFEYLKILKRANILSGYIDLPKYDITTTSPVPGTYLGWNKGRHLDYDNITIPNSADVAYNAKLNIACVSSSSFAGAGCFFYCFNGSDYDFIGSIVSQLGTNYDNFTLPSDCVRNINSADNIDFKYISSGGGDSNWAYYNPNVYFDGSAITNSLTNADLIINGTDVWDGSSSTSNDITTPLNNYLDGCEADSTGYCTIPLEFSSTTGGIQGMSGIDIKYDNFSKTNDFSSALNSFLSSGSCDGGILDDIYCVLTFDFGWLNFGNLIYSDINIIFDTYMSVTLESPTNNSYSPATKTFNCSATDEIQLSNITFYFYNSTGSLNLSTTIPLTGTSNSTTYDMTFNSTDTYTWGCSAFNNNSREWWADDNFTINVDIDNPVVNSLSPADNSWDNQDSNITFYYTPSHSTDTIDTCKLYSNWTGTWSANQTDNSINVSNQNNFTLNLSGLTDNNYDWTVWCNVTSTGNSAYSQSGNYTINLDSCKYSIFNSTGGIDGLNENVSFTCGSDTSPTVTAYGTYNLTIYGIDLALNENSSTGEFTITTAGVTTGGGGGNGEDIEKIPVIALQEIEGEMTYDELERAIFYARINTFCSIKKTSQVLAIQDFSGECSLKKSDIEKIVNEISLEGFIVSANDFILFYDKYNTKELEQVYMASEIIKVNGLFTSVLGITNPMRVNPPRLDRPFIIMDADGNITIEHVFTVNKEVKECAIISGEGFGCEVITDNSVKMSLHINDTDFFDKIFQGEMSITSDADPENIEIKRISLIPRVYNLSYNILGVPVIVLLVILGLLILVVAVFLIFRGKIRKKLRSRR